jgi:hypothetical protein
MDAAYASNCAPARRRAEPDQPDEHRDVEMAGCSNIVVEAVVCEEVTFSVGDAVDAGIAEELPPHSVEVT